MDIFTAMSSRTDKHKYEQVVNKEGEGHQDDSTAEYVEQAACALPNNISSFEESEQGST